VPGFGLIFALITITVIGFMAANLAGRTMIAIWDKTLYAMPVVRSIYKGSKQIFETLFSQKGASFRHVCLVEWPRRGAWPTNGFWRRSSPSRPAGPWPGWKVTTSPSGKSRTLMEAASCSKSPPGRSVRPTEPRKSVSPATTRKSDWFISSPARTRSYRPNRRGRPRLRPAGNRVFVAKITFGCLTSAPKRTTA
jgi:hypothetical protein